MTDNCYIIRDEENGYSNPFPATYAWFIKAIEACKGYPGSQIIRRRPGHADEIAWQN